MSTFLYFAYGSNMLLERLQHESRCPSATVIGNATAKGYGIEFCKRSSDGSGKATLVKGRKTDSSCGVLFEIQRAELPKLDKAEGTGKTYKKPGYERIENFKVLDQKGREVKTTTYIANETHIDRNLLPYDWYVALVKAGAMQNGVPGFDHKIDSKRDSNISKSRWTKALNALNKAGLLAIMGLTHYRTRANSYLRWEA